MTAQTLDTPPSVEEFEKARGYKIGSGCFRTVFRVPGSRWVYKVDSDGSVNAREYTTYLKYRPSLQGNVKFPEMHLLPNGILAAEYIEGEIGEYECWNWKNGVIGCVRNCIEDCWAKRIEFLARAIRDLHYQNIRIQSDGTIYIIDLGEGEQGRLSY